MSAQEDAMHTDSVLAYRQCGWLTASEAHPAGEGEPK